MRTAPGQRHYPRLRERRPVRPTRHTSGDIVETAKPALQASLDGLGLIPGLGEVADGANCAWYAHDGEKANAALSCAATVPFYGWLATAGKWTSTGAKLSDEAVSAESAAVGAMCGFSGETLVEMGGGSSKPISQVKVGDEVLATDPETGGRGPRKVTHLWVHSDTLLALETDSGTLTTTEDHPFWNATDREFQRADQLGQGDQLLTASGQLVRVIGIRPGSEHVATAYNLTVDGIHTYYVVAGATAILVHNFDGCEIGRDLIDGQAQMHIISGDLTGGGHKWPGAPGKSVFPPLWDTERILNNVVDVATSPSSTWTWQTGAPGSIYTKAGDSSKVKIEGPVEGVTCALSMSQRTIASLPPSQSARIKTDESKLISSDNPRPA